MIAILIVFLVLVVFLAFFIGNNLSNLCTFWFFKDMPDTSVLVLILCSFAAGIIFSILVFFFGKIKIMSKNNTKNVDSVTEKETKFSKKEKKRFLKKNESVKAENKSKIIVKD